MSAQRLETSGRHRVRAPSMTDPRRRRVTIGAAIALVAGLSSVAVRLPTVVLVPSMIVLLAGIDIAGALAAKTWADAPGIWVFVAGSGIYILLFWTYALSLRHGELTTVTIGWVVVITVGTMVLDQFHYGAHFPLSKWIAALAVVVLLSYLVLDTGSDSPADGEAPVGSSSGL
ncbi:MAG: hypothetical protein JWM76_2379 [Pseudonocardiales bacterium]|nr:hypothetical protein [Pseudonocardiales bacterium]